MSQRFQFSLRAVLGVMALTSAVAWEAAQLMRHEAPVPVMCRVVGHVQVGEEPITNAEVRFSGYRGRGAPSVHESAFTNHAGDFSILLPSGPYDFSVSPEEHIGRADPTHFHGHFDYHGRTTVSESRTTTLLIAFREQDVVRYPPPLGWNDRR
jgi:hypothetical protein